MKKVLAAFALAAFVSPALAQPVPFETADSDGNGAVSWAEVQAILPDITEEQFQAADSDGSGDLSEQEFSMLGM